MPPLVTFGIPLLSDEISHGTGKEFLRILEHRMARPMLLRVASTYSELVDGLAEGKYDFAWLPPVEAHQLAAHAGVELLLQARRAGNDYYHSLIFARDDSPIRSPTHLSGKKMAFVHRRSASGYLVPAAYLLANGIEIASPPLFLRSHEAVVLAVSKGMTDAGATYGNVLGDPGDLEITGAAWSQLAPGLRHGMRTIACAGPIPTDTICAWPGTSKALRTQLIDAVQAVMSTPDQAKTMYGLFGTDSFSTPQGTGYEILKTSHATLYTPCREKTQSPGA